MRSLVRYIDLVVLALSVVIFIAGDEPILGWAAIAIAWPLQRGFQAWMESRAESADDTHGFFRYMAGSLIGRAWIIAVAIFAVGIIDRPSGLAAAILAGIVFTTYLITSLIHRPKGSS